MCPIDPEQSELIFDYCMGLSGPSDAAQAEALIAQSVQAAELHATIHAALVPLSYLPAEYCPLDLAERTLQRLHEASEGGAVRRWSSPTIFKLRNRRYLGNFAGVAVTAASIVLIVSVLAQSFSVVRQHCSRQQCGSHLEALYQAASLYSSDFDGLLPAVPQVAGAAWHAIGSQAAGSCSNTRNPFLLLKLGYADKPSDFLCCGKTGHDVPPLKRDDLATLSDFPSRDYITYSYGLMPSSSVRLVALGSRPLMADMNPYFEHAIDDAARASSFLSDEETLHLNSPNHGRRGQNILLGDGAVRYSSTRFVDNPEDDIYTMTDGDTGGGRRRPAGLHDAMLAP